MKRYCGRYFSDEEIGQLCALIAEHPSGTRAQLSRWASRLLQWRKADGGLKEMSCRVAMLRMHREGLLQLPPPRNRKGGSSRIEHTFWSAPQPLLSRPVHELPGVHLELVLSRPDSALWNEYIDRYHYLGYTPLAGAQLRYFARWEDRILALLGFGAPAWKTAPRDRFIGWGPSQRESNLQLIVNNARFLILPWVQSKNLASKLLALAARQLPQDWHDRYAYRPVLLETFVDSQRFTGACYKAANWIQVGQTQGRGKMDRDHTADLPTKSIWLYPLSKHNYLTKFCKAVATFNMLPATLEPDRKEDLMRRHAILVSSAFLALALMSNLVVGQARNKDFHKARHLEEVKGELEEAIVSYRQVLSNAADEAWAARAQLHIGMCYEKLGKQEAQRAYQAVIDGYPSQQKLVHLARQRLDALGRAEPLASAKKESPMVVRRVWAHAPDTGGVPSPDGRYLTYTDWFTGNLAARNLRTGQAQHLTHKGSWSDSREFSEFSVVSPYGTQVAYGWYAGKSEDNIYELRLVEYPGSESRVLYNNPEISFLWPFSWSSDGRDILTLLRKRDKTNQIALISVADGSARILKTLDWRAPSKMSLSPDGRYIVYDFPPQENSPKRDIFLLAADGSREVPLIQHPANEYGPLWAPDGGSVVFVSDRTGAPGVWAVPVSNGKGQASPQLVRSDVGNITPMAFTDKGSYYYGLNTGTFEVYVVELDPKTGKVLAAPRKPIEHFEGDHWWPDWSRDGKSLAYARQESNVVVIRSMATGQEREFPQKTHRWALAGWFPDGQALLVRARGSGFHRMDVQTGDLTLLVRSEADQYFSSSTWSQDGKSLFYQSNERVSLRRILVRNLETRQEKELYRVENPHSC